MKVRFDALGGLLDGLAVDLGHDDRRHLLTRAVGEADHRQLADEIGARVDLLQLVGIDVLPVGVDDDLLRTARR